MAIKIDNTPRALTRIGFEKTKNSAVSLYTNVFNMEEALDRAVLSTKKTLVSSKKARSDKGSFIKKLKESIKIKKS